MTNARIAAWNRLAARTAEFSTIQLQAVAAELLPKIFAAPDEEKRDLRIARLAVIEELRRRGAR